MVLIAKEPSLCNQNWIKRLFYSVLMDASGCKRTVPLQPQKNRPFATTNQKNRPFVTKFGLVGCLTVCWWVIFWLGGDETKASDWLSGAFATVKKIVFYCFFKAVYHCCKRVS